MSFLNPLFLLGAVAVAAPIIVHLFRRQEARKIRFSSLMFVSHSPSRSWRRLRLRNLLLLALRMAVFVFLVLAFTRPFFEAGLGTASAGSSRKSVVVLLDDSFSMRSGDRLTRARSEALKVLEGLGENDSSFVVAFSDTSRVLGPPGSTRAKLVLAIQELKPSFRRTDYAQALKLAGQLLASVPNTIQEIHLISDFQESGWDQRATGVAVSEKVKVVPHDVAPRSDQNAFVTQLQISQTGARENLRAKVAARVASTARLSGPLRLEVNGKILEETPVNVEPGRTELVEFDPFPVGHGVNRGAVRLAWPDSLSDDDVAYFVLNPKNRQRLLLLTSDGNRESMPGQEDFYLRKALAAGGQTPFDVEVQKAAEAEAANLASYSAVLMYDPASIPSGFAARLEKFVELGGGLVIVLGAQARDTELNQKLAAVLPARLGAKRVDPKGLELIARLEKQHNVFKVFEPVHQSYFLTTPFRGYFECSPAPDSTTLMELEDSRPLLVERRSGKGRVLLFTSSFSTDWNDLPLKSVFLPFCQELAKYAMNFDGASEGIEVGDSIPVARLNRNLGRALDEIAETRSAASYGWTVRAPSGAAIELTGEELVNSPFFTVEEPGFYATEVRNTENAIAVNLHPAESDLRKIDPTRLLASIERKSSAQPETSAAGEIPREQREAWEGRQSLWWYLVVAAVLLLLVEGVVAKRSLRSKKPG